MEKVPGEQESRVCTTANSSDPYKPKICVVKNRLLKARGLKLGDCSFCHAIDILH